MIFSGKPITQELEFWLARAYKDCIFSKLKSEFNLIETRPEEHLVVRKFLKKFLNFGFNFFDIFDAQIWCHIESMLTTHASF